MPHKQTQGQQTNGHDWTGFLPRGFHQTLPLWGMFYCMSRCWNVYCWVCNNSWHHSFLGLGSLSPCRQEALFSCIDIREMNISCVNTSKWQSATHLKEKEPSSFHPLYIGSSDSHIYPRKASEFHLLTWGWNRKEMYFLGHAFPLSWAVQSLVDISCWPSSNKLLYFLTDMPKWNYVLSASPLMSE